MTRLTLRDVSALVFDVQGTVTDFRTTLATLAERLSGGRVADIDWGQFVDEWRGMYRPALDDVLAGRQPWTSVHRIYRDALDRLLVSKSLDFFDESERATLTFGWQQIQPWPDAREGLERLRRKFKIATLSNADVSAVINISKQGGLSWDAVFAAEMAGTFKPNPKTYELALRYLGLQPHEVMMVACHKYDLRAAKALGLRTGFVARPLEFGPNSQVDVCFDPDFDVNANDFLDLAKQLGC